MSAMASHITSLTNVYSTVYTGADQWKHQSSAGNSPVTGEFPVQMASNAENVSIWWRHRDSPRYWPVVTGGFASHISSNAKSVKLRNPPHWWQRHRLATISNFNTIYSERFWKIQISAYISYNAETPEVVEIQSQKQSKQKHRINKTKNGHMLFDLETSRFFATGFNRSGSNDTAFNSVKSTNGVLTKLNFGVILVHFRVCDVISSLSLYLRVQFTN